jgi:hypothetical protein
MLKKAGLTIDDVMAEAFAKEIDSFERFDRMLASAEARRNNALRETPLSIRCRSAASG